jgi:D-alanyl-D-alanine carboxypeptidase (penicillin-binding protein 5/6)
MNYFTIIKYTNISLILALIIPSITTSYEFTTNAKQAIAIEYNSGEILFEYNSNQKMVPSSMSKLMTLYIAFAKLKSGEIKDDNFYIVSRSAWKRGGSTMFLMDGQRVKLKDLLYGIAIVSGNDACITLAEGLMGSEIAFVNEMNNVAKRLELNNSHFANSSGWPDSNHYMTAYDLVNLAIILYREFPEYYYLFSEKNFSYNKITQNNSNEMLFENSNVDGIKTGRTDNGGFGVVISAADDNRRFFLVINGLESSKERVTEAKKLLQYLLNNFETKQIFKKNDIIDNIDVLFGEKQKLPIILNDDLFITYKKDNKPNIKVTLHYENNIEAPIKIGQEIAYINVSIPGKVDRKITICSTYSIEKLSGLKVFFKKIFKVILP